MSKIIGLGNKGQSASQKISNLQMQLEEAYKQIDALQKAMYGASQEARVGSTVWQLSGMVAELTALRDAVKELAPEHPSLSIKDQWKNVPDVAFLITQLEGIVQSAADFDTLKASLDRFIISLRNIETETE